MVFAPMITLVTNGLASGHIKAMQL